MSTTKGKYELLKQLIRQAIADYMASEGCGCCSDAEWHAENEKKLAELLDVPMYEDGSGYDFAKFRTK